MQNNSPLFLEVPSPITLTNLLLFQFGSALVHSPNVEKLVNTRAPMRTRQKALGYQAYTPSNGKFSWVASPRSLGIKIQAPPPLTGLGLRAKNTRTGESWSTKVQSDFVEPNQLTLIVFLKFRGREGVTQTNNIRELVEVIEPGTARYRGDPSLSHSTGWNEGRGKKIQRAQYKNRPIYENSRVYIKYNKY